MENRKDAEARGSSPDAMNSEFPNWETDLADSLKSIDTLDPSRSPCPTCVFMQKASLLFLSFDAAPAGDWKDKILDRLVSALADASTEKTHHVEWLFWVHALLNVSRSADPQLAKELRTAVLEGYSLNGLPSDYGPQIRLALQRTGNRTLNSYVLADELLQNEFVLPYALPPHHTN